MPGDPYWDKVVFLAGFEGVSVVDESSYAWPVNLFGSTGASSSQAKFGSKSLNRPSTSSPNRAQVAANAVFPKGGDLFTVEGWFRFSDVSAGGSHELMGQLDFDDYSTSGWLLDWRNDTTDVLRLLVADGSLRTAASGAWTPTVNVWYHLGADFDGTTYRVYVDGVVKGSGTTLYTMNDPVGQNFTVGTGLYQASDDGYFQGFIDEVRITVGAARYAGAFTAPVAAFPRTRAFSDTMAEGTWLVEGARYGSGSLVVDHLRDVAGVVQTQALLRGYRLALADGTLLVDQLRRDQGVVLTQGIGAHDATIPQLALLLHDVVVALDMPAVLAKYQGWTSDTFAVSEALIAGWVMSLTSGVGVMQAQTAVRGVVVAEALGLLQGQVAAAIYRLTSAERARLADSLGRFFGGELSEGILLDPVLLGKLQARPVLTDAVGLADTLTPRLLLRSVLADGVELDAAQALQMFFKPAVVEGVELSAGYLSPSGSITAWALNTTTAAVTEYVNYGFNSFASRGNTYVGASDDGLYELVGDTDAGEDIVARIKSGFMQFAGAKFGLLKRIYMAQRGTGDYVLRIITGDDKTYDYAVTPANMRTTRVHLGKGLRARYFAFELISTGQDFDLESLEFVPIPAARRV